MENSVIFSNPVFLIPLIIAALLWLWSHRKKNKVIPVISYLTAIAVMVFGALNGAGYEELIIIALAFALSGVIEYNGEREDGK